MRTILAGKLFVAVLLLGGPTCVGRTKDDLVKHQVQAGVSGTITVDILDAGSPRRYWQYTLRPADGTVTRASEQQFATKQNSAIPPGYLKPAGAIFSCTDKPEAKSPDSGFVATCEGSLDSARAFVITECSTKKELVRWTPSEYRGIRGFAWAPDSKSVAVLNESEHYGKAPLELLWGLSGHPVPHNTVFVELFQVDDGKRTEYVIRKDVINAFTRILNWNQ
jgi:hypothetical protein